MPDAWLNVSVKIPARWVGADDESVPDAVECIIAYFNAGDGVETEIEYDGGDAAIVSTGGRARYGMASIEDSLNELIRLRIPFVVRDDGEGPEGGAPPSWMLYDGHVSPAGDKGRYITGSDEGMSRAVLVAILEGTHAWARTPLDYFDHPPTLEQCSIEHLEGAPHPDDEDDIDEEVAVL